MKDPLICTTAFSFQGLDGRQRTFLPGNVIDDERAAAWAQARVVRDDEGNDLIDEAGAPLKYGVTRKPAAVKETARKEVGKAPTAPTAPNQNEKTAPIFDGQSHNLEAGRADRKADKPAD